MAQSITAGTGNYLSATAAATAAPLTLACWFKYGADDTHKHHLMAITDPGSSDDFFLLQASGQIAGDPIRAIANAGASSFAAVTSTGMSLETWHHACAVFASATDRRAYLDGGGKGTNSTSAAPSGLTTLSMQALRRISTSASDGTVKIGHAGIWSAALSDAEVASLAHGFCPMLVRPGSLLAYYPLSPPFVGDTNYNNRLAGYNLSKTGTVAGARGPISVFFPAPYLTHDREITVFTASVAPIDIDIAIPAVTAAGVLEASVAPIDIDIAIPAVTAAGVWEASVAPIDIDIAIPAVTAAGVWEASVAPIDIDIAIPAVSPVAIAPASVTPAVAQIAIPAVTATGGAAASVSPASVVVSIPSVSPVAIAPASVSPAVAQISIPAVTATAGVAASVSPLGAQIAIPEVTAAYLGPASVSPSEILLTIPAVTATATLPVPTGMFIQSVETYVGGASEVECIA